jgi:hypothetical protein
MVNYVNADSKNTYGIRNELHRLGLIWEPRQQTWVGRAVSDSDVNKLTVLFTRAGTAFRVNDKLTNGYFPSHYLILSGDTYPVRDKIKKFQYVKFDSRTKAWHVYYAVGGFELGHYTKHEILEFAEKYDLSVTDEKGNKVR